MDTSSLFLVRERNKVAHRLTLPSSILPRLIEKTVVEEGLEIRTMSNQQACIFWSIFWSIFFRVPSNHASAEDAMRDGDGVGAGEDLVLTLLSNCRFHATSSAGVQLTFTAYSRSQTSVIVQ